MRKLLNEELGRLSKDEFVATPKMDVVVVLDNVRSHLNVGSVFRSCDAFPVRKVLLCGITGTPPHRDIQKTALGATETVEWEYAAEVVEAVEKLKSAGYVIASVEQADKAVALHQIKELSNKPIALVFGNEVEGVHQKVVSFSDCCIEIPQFGTKHSLNIAVSVGVVLWEVTRLKILRL